MLLIVNGMPSTNKHVIAGHISNSLNGLDNIEIDGFVCDFTGDTINIKKDGEDVYRVGTSTHDSIDTILSYAPEVYDKAEELFAARKYKYVKYVNFADCGYSLGMDEYEEPEFKKAYPLFLENYQSIKNNFKYVVITGSFAPHFIDRFEKDTNETAEIVNVIRHPNISFLLDDSHTYFKEEGLHPDMKQLGIEFVSGALNALLAAKRPNTTTVRYEDILSSGQIEVNGKSIIIPELRNNDGNLTADEKTHIINIVRPERVKEVSLLVDMLSTLDQMSPNLPKDIYEELGYDKNY